jgi:hypothetical protein
MNSFVVAFSVGLCGGLGGSGYYCTVLNRASVTVLTVNKVVGLKVCCLK